MNKKAAAKRLARRRQHVSGEPNIKNKPVTKLRARDFRLINEAGLTAHLLRSEVHRLERKRKSAGERCIALAERLQTLIEVLADAHPFCEEGSRRQFKSVELWGANILFATGIKSDLHLRPRKWLDRVVEDTLPMMYLMHESQTDYQQPA